MNDPLPKLDVIALDRCANLLTTKAALALPRSAAEALIVLAFQYGAAWALEMPDVIETSDAQLDAMRSAKQ